MSEEETRKRTSAILGHPVSDSAWSEAWEKAKRKIRHIAEFCGYNGCREQPGYMAQIAAEYIREAAFSAWTIMDNKEKGRQKLTTPEHTPTVYHVFYAKSRRTHNGAFDVEP